MGGIHIKGCFPDCPRPGGPAARDGMTYHQLTATKRLWAEPGLGVVNFDAVLAAIPEDYDADYTIEVDEPSVDSRRLSLQVSFDWASRAVQLAPR